MRHSTEPRETRYVKEYGFLSFVENIGKNMSSKYSRRFLVSAIKYWATKVATDAIKTASKRTTQKTAEALGGCRMMKSCNQMRQIMKYQKKDIYLQKKDNKLLMNED